MPDKTSQQELEEALDESMPYLMSGESSLSDPLLPLNKYIAKVALPRVEERFNSGDKYALLHAIYVCATHDLLMPEWVKKAYIEGMYKVNNLEVRRLEDVFGSPLKKGEHIAAARKKNKYAARVCEEVGIAIRDGKAIDTALFEEIGLKLGLGKTLVSEYYYELINIFGFRPKPPYESEDPFIRKLVRGTSAKP